jgi:hypothetical protein
MKKTGLTFAAVLLAAIAMATCRVDTILGYKYDSGLNSRTLTEMSVKHYNADNVLDTTRNLNRKTNGDWYYVSRVVYTINAAGLPDILLSQGFDTTTQQWKNGNRTLYYYDASNNCIQRVNQNWNNVLSVWENNLYNEMSYETNRNLVSSISKTWVMNAWLNTQCDSFFYSSTNKEVLSYSKKWNGATNAWDHYRRNTTYYSVLDSIAQGYIDFYDTATGVWYNGYQTLYTYNVNDKLSIQEMRRWANNIFDYANYSKITYTYDADNRLLERNEQLWDETTSSWLNYSKILNEYNVSGEVWATETSVGWVTSGSYYSYRAREEFICAAGAVAISDVDADPYFAVYPNPVTAEAVHITTAVAQPFALYDLSGKVITEGRLQPGDNALTIPTVAPGMYLLKTAGNTRKLIIE